MGLSRVGRGQVAHGRRVSANHRYRSGAHPRSQAVIADAQGHDRTPVFTFHSTPADHARACSCSARCPRHPCSTSYIMKVRPGGGENVVVPAVVRQSGHRRKGTIVWMSLKWVNSRSLRRYHERLGDESTIQSLWRTVARCGRVEIVPSMDERNVSMLMECTLIRRHGFSADQCKNRCTYQRRDWFRTHLWPSTLQQLAPVPRWIEV